MKLELKHITPYFNFRLRGNAIAEDWDIKEINQEVFRIETGRTKDNPENEEPFLIVGDSEIGLDGFTPIFKPLSDLTDKILKEIYKDENLDIVRMKYQIVINYTLMGEWFKDVINLRRIFDIENSHLTMPAWLYFELISRHFDMYFLIDNELAIDINTI